MTEAEINKIRANTLDIKDLLKNEVSDYMKTELYKILDDVLSTLNEIQKR